VKKFTQVFLSRRIWEAFIEYNCIMVKYRQLLKGEVIMISLIVAVAKNNVIGNNGIIPWKIKGEQKRFDEVFVAGGGQVWINV
jgi:hypothetical protein